MSLSDEQVVEYIRGGGKVCPYCQSADIEGGERDYGGSDLYQEVTCKSCGETWSDHYRLIGIGSIDAQDPADLIETLKEAQAFILANRHDLAVKADKVLKTIREAIGRAQ